MIVASSSAKPRLVAHPRRGKSPTAFTFSRILPRPWRPSFGTHEAVLKAVASQLADKNPAPPKAPAAQRAEQERKRRHAKRVRRHHRIWKLFRAGHRIEEIARLVGVGSQTVYRALKHEQPPAPETRRRTHHVTDPYLPYLCERWNAGCHTAMQLYEEIVAQGYTGSRRSIDRIVAQLRPNGTKPVSRQTVTQGKAPSARSVALMMVRPPAHRTKEQLAFIDDICQRDPTIAIAFTLTQEFGDLLRERQGVQRFEHWKASVQESGIKELTRFVEGLADDAEAVANACTEPWSNGMVEGFNHKVKLIKRSSYGQAGFPLLQRRLLLHPAARHPVDPEHRRRSSRRSPSAAHHRVRGAESVRMATAAA